MSSSPTSITASLTLQGKFPKKYSLSPNESIIIGRSPECQIVVSADEFVTVSRCHAQLKLVSEGDGFVWQVSDLGTTNGTLVNNHKIDEPLVLKTGDRITLGWKGPEFLFEASFLNPTVLVVPPDLEIQPQKSQTEIITEEKPEAVIAASPQILETSTEIANAEVNPEEKSASNLSPSPKLIKTEPLENPVISTKTSEEKTSQPPKVAKIPDKSEKSLMIEKKSDSSNLQPGKNSVNIWNYLKLKEVYTISGFDGKINAMAFSGDNQTLAIVGSDKSIKLCNLETQSEIVTLSGHKLAINTVAFSPDGKILATGGADKSVKIWDLETQSEIFSLSGHKLAINTVAFSPDGKILATGGADKSVKIWDLETQSEIFSLSGHKLAINALAFSPDGKILATGGADKLIKLWNLETQTEIISHKTNHQGTICYLSFALDGAMICTCGNDKTVKLILAETGEEFLSFLLPVDQLIAFTIGYQGQILMSGEGEFLRCWSF